MPFSNTARQVASHLRPRSTAQHVVTAVVVALLIAGVASWALGRGGSPQAQSTVTTVTTGTFQQTVSGSGTIQPSSQAALAFDVSGRVASVEVTAGDTVKKSEVLARLDTASLDAALASAKAKLDAAETTAADDGGETSTRQAANDADLASARADVAQAEDDLDAAVLRATIAGTVAAVDLSVGDRVGSSSGSSGSGSQSAGTAGPTGTSAAASTSTSTAAITVVEPESFTVDVDVAATDIEKVRKGLQVEITPNGATEAIFGTVEDVGLVAETSTAGTATFPVTVKITGKQKDLYAGTSADVSIIVKQVENVLTVPSLALTTSGDKTYVNKIVGSSTQRTPVEIGTAYGASTEITSGLKSGDKVEVTAAQTPRGSSGAGASELPGDGGLPGGGFPGGGGLPGGGFPGGGSFPGGGNGGSVR